MGSPVEFGNALRKAWAAASLKVPFYEVQLFRAFMSALTSLSSRFQIEEFHGSKHQVVFTAAGPWSGMAPRCELSDLMIVTYTTTPEWAIRLTFLQAKKYSGQLALCSHYPNISPAQFPGDLKQWHLLSKRPKILGVPPFDPPSDLLSGALLATVGTFGVFHRGGRHSDGFMYAAADCLSPLGTPKRSRAQLNTTAGPAYVVTQSLPEMNFACCTEIFGYGLYGGLVGTPLANGNTVSVRDHTYRRQVNSWLANILRSSMRQTSQDRPAAGELLNYIGGEGRDDGVGDAPGEVPGIPHLLVIRSDRFLSADEIPSSIETQ